MNNFFSFSKIKNYLLLIRPHYWSKNLILFIPFFAVKDFNYDSLLNLIIGFFIFNLIASIGYIYNDIVDLNNDLKHKFKKNRPLCLNKVTKNEAGYLILILFISSFIIIYFFQNIFFTFFLLIYLIGTLFYSFALKKIFIIDLITISILFLVRIFAGSSVIDVTTSYWLFTFSILFFFSLVCLKRIVEIVDYANHEDSTFLRKNYSKNNLNFLIILATSANILSNFVIYFYISSEKVKDIYNNHEYLYISIPLLIFWFYNIISKTLKNKINIDPISYVLKDRISYLILILIIITVFISS